MASVIKKQVVDNSTLVIDNNVAKVGLFGITSGELGPSSVVTSKIAGANVTQDTLGPINMVFTAPGTSSINGSANVGFYTVGSTAGLVGPSTASGATQSILFTGINRPPIIIIYSGAGATGFFNSFSGGAGAAMDVAVTRDGTTAWQGTLTSPAAGNFTIPASISFLDTGASLGGSYTYELRVRANSGTTVAIASNVRMLIYES